MASRILLTPSVLVVNDALDEREMYARTLRASGYRAIEAATFTAAIQVATTEILDIVVTDVRIAGSISGLELTRRLRNDVRTATVPIIVLTSMSRPQDGDTALKAGADAFFEKPVPGAVLKAEILRLLAGSWPLLSEAAHTRQRSDPRHRHAKTSHASGVAEIPGHSTEAPDSLSTRPTESCPRASLESPCPSCGAAVDYRDRCPVLASPPVAPVDGERRERLRYVAGWFCTNPSCQYYQLSSSRG